MSEQLGRVLHVRMSSPPVNAFSDAFFDSLHAALLEVSPDTGAVVVTSAVDGVFAAGGDIRFMAAADAVTSERYVRRCQEIYGLLERPDHLSVVAIDGACLGGGLELALAADVRIASPSSRLGLPEVSLGILAGGGAIHRAVRALGQGAARDLLLTGEPVGGEHAHAWGLVTRLADDPVAEALALAEKVAAYSPEAVAATKALALSASTDELEAGLREELARWLEVRRGANAQEGLDAFAEKRAARFEARHG
ncbi:enoyl-CoA hydratase/isomerase family protein [Nocardioides caldifontis]|uniref:enoyl-CoA hydratase/isomerase family protein n=1 Tax=Nocardioides caldifontis TaxID=2588938 RepID=UPI0023B0340C|nr:enoyl-CoA hydratase/isomerase family protein [Nocardioides caldifontis]